MLPRHALGLGLRIPYYDYVFEHWPDVDYFEIISENFLGPAAPPRRKLARIRERYPVVLHGVGLNLLSHEAINERYVDDLCRLADAMDAPFFSDHLCWSGAHGMNHHDLLPTPFRPELVEYVAERIDYVQRRVGRPFAIENLSSYVTFQTSTMSEWEFYSAVVRESGSWYMLDINNIYVSSQNHGFDPLEYLRAIDFARVQQVHIAGHERQADGLIIDTHDHPVADAVWQLYRPTWAMSGGFPTLLEWDDRIPPMPVVLAELDKARRVRDGQTYE